MLVDPVETPHIPVETAHILVDLPVEISNLPVNLLDNILVDIFNLLINSHGSTRR